MNVTIVFNWFIFLKAVQSYNSRCKQLLIYSAVFCVDWRVLICSKQDNMTITLAPGYVLSRSKEKINVTITDDFFKEGTTKVS